jgi:hypothetical protein
MKKLLFYLAIFAFLVISCKAFSQDGPKITINPETWDLGEIELGAIKEKIFLIENSGDKDLTIESIFASCGCVSSELSKHEIEPKQTGELKVTYNSLGKPLGRDGKSLFIFSNDPLNPKLEVAITVKIVPKK